MAKVKDKKALKQDLKARRQAKALQRLEEKKAKKRKSRA